MFLVVKLAVALLGVLPALAAAQTAPPADTTPPLPPALRVGMSGDYPPFSVYDAGGTLTGFDVAVAQRWAADLGRRLQFVPFGWPELTARMQTGAFDVAMSGITIRPERALHMAFSRPYAVTGAVAVIRPGDRSRFATGDDLDRPDVRIIVNAGGHLERVTRRRFPRAQIVTVSDNTTLPARLLAGEADAAISEGFEAATWPPDLATIGPFTRDRKAYAVRTGDAELLGRLNEWLAAREADGWLDAQRRQWLGPTAHLSPQQAGVEALTAAMDLRLQLMPFVGAVKRREQVPIHDPEQEQRVLERVRADALARHLDPDDVAGLFRAQMDAAKVVESRSVATAADPEVSLAELRAAIARASAAVVAELARCAPWFEQPVQRQAAERTLRTGLAGSDLPAAVVDRVVGATMGVRVRGAGSRLSAERSPVLETPAPTLPSSSGRIGD